MLAEIGRVISSPLNIEEVYEKFACEVKKLIYFDKVSINVVDFGNATVSLAYVTGKSVPGRDAKDVLPLSGSFTEEVIKKTKGVIFHPANEDEVAARFPGLIPVYMSGLKSIMMVPLILRNQPIATMNFMSEAANVYTEADLELAEKIGRQIAGVIANVQFFNTHQQTLKLLEKKEKEARILGKENEIIAKLGKIISSSLNIDDVFEKFALKISQAIPFAKIGINTVDFKTNEVKIYFAFGKPVLGREDKDIFPLSGSFAEEVLKRKKGMFYHPADQAEVQKKFPGLLPVYQAGFKSIMTVPLIYKDQAFGTLNFMSESPNAFSEDNLRLAERVGNQIAGAVANALLFAEHQRSQKEKEDLQEQLLQAQKMEAIGRLAGGIAHDFNNSLTLMKVSAQLMQMELMELKDGHPWREKIGIILGAADRSAKLARQLLAFSRRQILEMKVIDLNQLIRELDKMLHRIIGEDIELAYILPEDLRRVKVDPGQMEQVILNLAVNARDAMPKGGKLIVETGNVELDASYAQQQVGVSPGQYVMLSVSDTGGECLPRLKPVFLNLFSLPKRKTKEPV